MNKETKYTVQLMACYGMAQMQLFEKKGVSEEYLGDLELGKVGDFAPLDSDTRLELWITEEDSEELE
jgi:hypothetical protein